MSHIYVAHGAGRIIKIGRSKQVDRRLRGVRKQFKLFGSELIEWRQFEVPEVAAHACEYSGIRAFEVFDPYFGREWFVGDFDRAVAIIETVMPASIAIAIEWAKNNPPLTPEQRAARDADRAARAAQQRAAEAERRQKRINGMVERRRLRETRKAEIALRLREQLRPGLAATSKEAA